MLKPYYLVSIENKKTGERVGLPFEFETFGEAEDYIAKLSPERTVRVLGLNCDPSDVYYHITAGSATVGIVRDLFGAWQKPTVYDVANAGLAALAILAVCGFVLAAWGLIETLF